MKTTLTEKRLRTLLHYAPDTGVFTRLESVRGVAAGSVAGTKHNRGYLAVRIDGSKYLLHRLAFLYMTGHLPTQGVDHVNGIKSDNRWSNLRKANQSENSQNRRLRKDSTSGATGISFKKAVRLWVVVITIDGKSKHIGYYKSLQEAVIAQTNAKLAHHPFQPIARPDKEKGESYG